MKARHIFWGIFFISIGILILLNNLGKIYFDLYDLWKFWPLVLIIWGFTFFVKNNILKSFLAAISGIILALALFAFFSYGFNFVGNSFRISDNGIQLETDENVDTTNYFEPYNDEIKNAELFFKAGAGSFEIEDTTHGLISAVTNGIKNNFEMFKSFNDTGSIVKFKMKQNKFSFSDGEIKNNVKIELNSIPEWDLNIEVGAASAYLDLRQYKTNRINVKMGAASLKIKLGDKSKTIRLNLKSGASSVDVYVPDSSGCEITTHTALSSKDFRNFHKINSNLYRTNNFEKSKKKIYIYVHSGISSIKVVRYSVGW
jgi:energy-coupling factor transporter transmembrane protein EcfT